MIFQSKIPTQLFFLVPRTYFTLPHTFKTIRNDKMKEKISDDYTYEVEVIRKKIE